MAEAARKLEYTEIYTANLDVKKNNNQLNKKLAKRRKTFLTLLYTFFVLISIVSAIFILSNYAKITSLNFEIRRIDAIIVEAEKTELNLHSMNIVHT